MRTGDSSAGAQDEDWRLLKDWLDGKVAADDDQAVLEYLIMRLRDEEERKAQDEDCKAAIEFILENLDEWRADLRIEDPHNVTKEHVKKLQRMVRLSCGGNSEAGNQNDRDVLLLFFMDVKRVVRMIGHAHGIRGAELVNADASIRYNAWEDLLAAVSAKESLPQWSIFRTPIEWRALLERAGRANSERKWSDLRKNNSDQMEGDARSVRITRSLANQWGLKLPEFTEGTRN